MRIFIYFFTPRFFFCDYTFSYCMKPSGMWLHIYSLPSSAFLKYQTSGFYCTWSKSHPLVDIFAKFHFHHSVFPRNTGLGTDILSIKLELYCALASKKINTRLVFVYYPNGNEMDQMVRNDIACYCWHSSVYSLQSFSFIIVFPAKYWTGHRYFIHKTGVILRAC